MVVERSMQPKTGVKDPLLSSACSLTVGSKAYNLISVSVHSFSVRCWNESCEGIVCLRSTRDVVIFIMY